MKDDRLQRLWAPWRLKWVKDTKGPQKKGCIFCALPAEANKNDKKNCILFKNNDLFVILNRFPYIPGHLMVIPRKHGADPLKLSPKIWASLSHAISLSAEALKKAVNAGGFNIGMNLGDGGPSVKTHLHWHIVPRWSGDTNFLPVLAQSKSMVSYNSDIYVRLSPHFKDFEKRLQQLIKDSTA